MPELGEAGFAPPQGPPQRLRQAWSLLSHTERVRAAAERGAAEASPPCQPTQDFGPDGNGTWGTTPICAADRRLTRSIITFDCRGLWRPVDKTSEDILKVLQSVI